MESGSRSTGQVLSSDGASPPATWGRCPAHRRAVPAHSEKWAIWRILSDRHSWWQNRRVRSGFKVDDNTNEVVRFRTERLEGERMRESDAGYLAQLHSDPEVMATIGGVRDSDESAAWLRWNLDHWNKHRFGQWMLRAADAGPIGRGGLRWIDECVGEHLVEVGFVLERSAWGKGYATEATRAFVDIAEGHYKFDQLAAITLEGNDASTRVLEKNGFVFERWVDHTTGPHKFLRLRLGDARDAE